MGECVMQTYEIDFIKHFVMLQCGINAAKKLMAFKNRCYLDFAKALFIKTGDCSAPAVACHCTLKSGTMLTRVCIETRTVRVST